VIEITSSPYRRVLAPILVMAVIFYFSAQPAFEQLSTFEVVLRKLGHVTGYALLTAAWSWALAPWLGRRALPVAALVAFLYAISDEYHQSFVEGRHSTPVDVGIDSVGIAIAWVVLKMRLSRPRTRSGAAGA
jgi:VanZ family protein